MDRVVDEVDKVVKAVEKLASAAPVASRGGLDAELEDWLISLPPFL